jgi:hypothetical protein
MPRVTKAQLQERVDNLEGANHFLRGRAGELLKENDELKKRLARGHDRSRSPRMPAANSQANVDMTCKALNLVKLWQQDTVAEEQRAEIRRLQAEAVQKDQLIESLRRGEGPVGEVLAHAYSEKCRRLGMTPSDFMLQTVLESNERPVYAFLQILQGVFMDLKEVVNVGRSVMPPTQLPFH